MLCAFLSKSTLLVIRRIEGQITSPIKNTKRKNNFSLTYKKKNLITSFVSTITPGASTCVTIMKNFASPQLFLLATSSSLSHSITPPSPIFFFIHVLSSLSSSLLSIVGFLLIRLFFFFSFYRPRLPCPNKAQ